MCWPAWPTSRSQRSRRIRCPTGSTAADSDTTLTDVIDLDEVANVRRLGIAALNRPWQQFRPDDQPLALPLYQGRIDPATWTGATAPAPFPGGPIDSSGLTGTRRTLAEEGTS